MFYTYYVKAEGKYYFGSRTPEIMLTRDAKDDFMVKYFTSTTDERLREIIRNKEYEKAEIIKEYTDRQECLKDEELLIENFWWLYGRLNCWNHQANGKFSTAGTQHSEEVKKQISESVKEDWNNMSEEEIEERIEKRRETYNNMSEERKQEISKKQSEALNNRSEEEKQEHYKKISEALKGEKHPMFGKHLSKETKEKMSNAKKGKQFSNEHKENISEALNGRKLSNEHKQNISEAWNNMSEEEKQEIIKKRSEANKGKHREKFYWKTTDGKIKTMPKPQVLRWHPDWILIGPVES